MALLLNLYLGHVLGDFLLQPGRLVLAKRSGAPGLLLHTGIVAAVSALVLGATIRTDWPAVLMVAGLHLVIERLTIVTYVRTPTRGLFTLLFDQTLHVLSIAAVVWLAGAWGVDGHAHTLWLTLTIPQLAALDGFVTVTLLGSILVFEVGNALLPAEDGKGRVLRFDTARVAGMLERGAAFATAVALSPALGIALGVPGSAWLPLIGLAAFAPRCAFALTRGDGERRTQLTECATGVVLCLAAYAALMALGYLTRGAGTSALTLGAAFFESM